MAIKISDYIMEQEISNASVDDIELARCFAEMEVISAMINCYAKQEIITEYTSTDISEFGIFQEADGAEEAGSEEAGSEDTKKKKDNLFKRAGQGFINLLKKLGEMIVAFFAKFKFKSLKERVMSGKINNYKFSGSVDVAVSNLSDLVDVYIEFGQLLVSAEAYSEEVKIEKGALEKILEKIKDINETVSGVVDTMSGNQSQDTFTMKKDEVVKLLTKLEECQNAKIPNVRKMLKRFDSPAIKGLDKETHALVKECATEIHKAYVKINKFCNEMVNKILKPQTSKNYKENYDV